ncbi:NAD dependent epimerase/dehydratase [Legionella wadsworthii]|uniref:NAD dependent epimerase/dehydratase n=1 Tax=Legionella wadsworthii TaxID=28088 RepID=A0A378M014_9GAMM|nr:FAD-dependent monooxygenase [Legionella wadsworthii]STY29661.1 NAD dependent epimerase/dehydratase [Legionella wadsworthii]
MSSTQVDVLIIGGGIGGLTAGLACRQAGFSTLILECKDKPCEAGAGIWLPPNALQVYEHLGLIHDLFPFGCNINQINLMSTFSGMLRQTNLKNYLNEYKFTILALHRARLLNYLLQKTERNSLLFNQYIAEVQQQDASVTVSLNGGERITAKIIIGADGIHSLVRDLIFGKSQIRYSGSSSFRGVITLHEETALKKDEVYEIWAPGCRLGYSFISNNEIYWYLTFDAKQSCIFSSKEKYQFLSKCVDQHFPKQSELMRTMHPERIIHTDLTDLVPLKQWNHHRICLLGDAAHAMTPNLGQGAAQAIEDALALATTLKRFGLNQNALFEYNAIRIKKVNYIVKKSWDFGKLCHLRSRPKQATRDFLVRNMPHRVENKIMNQMYTPLVQ